MTRLTSLSTIFFRSQGGSQGRFGLETWSPQLSYKPMSYGTARLKTRLKLGLGIQFKKKEGEGEKQKLGSLLKKNRDTE